MQDVPRDPASGDLNQEKIRLMSLLSIFEKKEGKEVIEASQYYKGDYVVNQVLKTLLHFSLCFWLLAVAWIVMQLDQILENLNLAYLQQIFGAVFVFYLSGVVIVASITALCMAFKYDIAFGLGNFYAEKLEKLLLLEEGKRIRGESYSDDFQYEVERLKNPLDFFFDDEDAGYEESPEPVPARGGAGYGGQDHGQAGGGRALAAPPYPAVQEREIQAPLARRPAGTASMDREAVRHAAAAYGGRGSWKRETVPVKQRPSLAADMRMQRAAQAANARAQDSRAMRRYGAEARLQGGRREQGSAGRHPAGGWDKRLRDDEMIRYAKREASRYLRSGQQEQGLDAPLAMGRTGSGQRTPTREEAAKMAGAGKRPQRKKELDEG